MRGATAVELDRTLGPLLVVAAALRASTQERECPKSQSGGRFSSATLPRPVQDPREQPLHAAQSLEAAAAVAGRSLPGGREREGQAVGRGGQVPRAEEVPAAANHLGRRGDELLLQGKVANCSPRLVPAQSVSVAAREARASRRDRPDHHPGEQLVQEQTSEGPSRRGQRQVRVHFLIITMINILLFSPGQT